MTIDTAAIYIADALKIVKREIEAREAFPAEYDADITNAMKVLVLGEAQAARDPDELLPCPFCGESPAIEMTGFHLNGRTIYCAGNECMGPSTTAASFEDAALQWNKRAHARCSEGIAGLASLVREYARDLRRNSSGGDDYPWEIMRGVADYLEILIERSRASGAGVKVP